MIHPTCPRPAATVTTDGASSERLRWLLHRWFAAALVALLALLIAAVVYS